jgi:hypothetical protein
MDSSTDVQSFVEYETMPDLQSAVEKLDNREFKGQSVHCASTVGGSPLSLADIDAF